jgi:hypothetical protein
MTMHSPSRWWHIRIPSVVWLAGALSLLAMPVSTGAQDVTTPPPYETAATDVNWSEDVPAHIAVVDGRATLERDGTATAAEENVPLLAGDRLVTERGRVEVLFADGSVFDLDEDTAVDFQSESLVRLIDGRVRISIPRTGGGEFEYRVDTAAGSALLRSAGEYRVTLDPRQSPQVDVAVFRGVAELANIHGRTVVRAGSHAYATEGTTPTEAYAFNSAAYDPLDRWAEDLRRDRYGDSAQYLPADIRHYGGYLDDYGTWLTHASYGRVWYPRVHTGWRPYSVGRWSVVGRFGWFWIGVDRWSYVTHHYGRWHFGGGSWFWVPHHRWSPAWVSWAYTPEYVSWCPIGFDGRPSIAFHDPYYDPWIGWTVVPAHVFVRPVFVRPIIVQQVVIAGHRLPRRTFSQFVVRDTAPVVRVAGRAAPRPLTAPTRNRTGILSSDDINGRAATASTTKASSPTVLRGGRTDASNPAIVRRPDGAAPPEVIKGSRTEVPSRSRAGSDEPVKSVPGQAAPPDRGSRSEPPSTSSRSRTETGSVKSAPPSSGPPPSRAAPPPASSKGSAPSKSAPPSTSQPPAGSRKGGSGGAAFNRTPTATLFSPRQPAQRTGVPASRSAAPASRSGVSGPAPRTSAPPVQRTAPAPRTTKSLAPPAQTRTPASSPRYSPPATSSRAPASRWESPVPRARSSSSSGMKAPEYAAPAPRSASPAPRYTSPSPRSSAPTMRSPAPAPRQSAPVMRSAPSPKASAPSSGGASRTAPARSAPASRAPGRAGKGGGA